MRNLGQTAISMVAAGALVTIGHLPSASAATATASLVLNGLPGYSVDVYETGSKLGGGLGKYELNPACRAAIADSVSKMPTDAVAYRGDISRIAADGSRRTTAYSVLVSLDDPQVGRAAIASLGPILASCPDTGLRPGEYGARPSPMRLRGVEAQVAQIFTIKKDGQLPTPGVVYVTGGILGYLELEPTGDEPADLALWQDLAQNQVDRINARNA
ncbi:hypothetical protein DSM43276_01653 [Mycobacteroides salmoniphilum]|nr:hypothetical protein DSM43276_01653 [Mycobacteroides salmoniphilum]